MTESQLQQECPPPRTPEAVDCWLRKWDRDAAADGTEPLTRQDVECWPVAAAKQERM